MVHQNQIKHNIHTSTSSTLLISSPICVHCNGKDIETKSAMQIRNKINESLGFVPPIYNLPNLFFNDL